MIQCHCCHANNEETARFCANCGESFSQNLPQTTVQYAPPSQYTPVPPPAPSSPPAAPYPSQQVYPPPPPPPAMAPHPSQQAYPPPPPQAPIYAAPPPQKTKRFPVALVIILVLVLLVATVYILFFRQKPMLNAFDQQQTLTQAFVHAGKTLEIEEAIMKLTNMSQQGALPTPQNTISESTPAPEIAEPTEPVLSDQDATAQAEQDLLLKAMVTATAGFEQTQQANLADQEAERARIAKLIPEEERWRLDTATKIDDVPQSIEETYVKNNKTEAVLLADNLKNFMLTITYQNHEAILWEENWDIGFWFRSKNDVDRYRLLVTVPNYYELAYLAGIGNPWTTIKGWKAMVPSINYKDGGENTLVFIAEGSTGKLYVNGDFVTDFSLRSSQKSGSIYAWIDFRSAYRSGNSMIMKDIHIWNLD